MRMLMGLKAFAGHHLLAPAFAVVLVPAQVVAVDVQQCWDAD